MQNLVHISDDLTIIKDLAMCGKWSELLSIISAHTITKSQATNLAGQLLLYPDVFSKWMEQTKILPTFSKLYEACSNGNYKPIEWLLEHKYIRADIKDSILLLASVNHIDIFRLLAAKGAHVLTCKFAEDSLLDYALHCGTEDTVLWLLNQYPELYAGKEAYYAQQCLMLHKFRALSVLLWKLARGVVEHIIVGLISMKDSICPELCETVSKLLRRNTEWSEEFREAAREHFKLAYHEVMPET